MKSACFIPIKAYSERVPGKNFRMLNGKKLYEYIIEHAIQAEVFDDIYVDTNSEEIAEYATAHDIKVLERKPELALNSANGNDLLVYHAETFPIYEYYFQLFATAPYLSSETIRKCVEGLTSSESYDSCFTAIKHSGFFWIAGMPANYRPGILPRSQDNLPVIEETTGLYGVKREALKKYRCRIGRNPMIFIVDKKEAVDINAEEDLIYAEIIGKKQEI